MITYQRGCEGIDWAVLKADLVADDFDNGRTPEQLQRCCANSAVNIFALDGARVIGTARVLSDGVCNAYMVDVWTHSAYRRQRIGATMVEMALEALQGQHVYLFTDSAVDFYRSLDFEESGIGMERVVGQWLVNNPVTPFRANS
jgi:ribosomal protein S18 acetylase RimI-like enzyme